MKIAHLDDEPDQLFVFKSNLEQFNENSLDKIEGVFCSNEKQFLSTLDKSFDAVVIDVCMPFANGYEVAEKVMREFPNIIVFMCSSFIPPDKMKERKNVLFSLMSKEDFKYSELLNRFKSCRRSTNVYQICYAQGEHEHASASFI